MHKFFAVLILAAALAGCGGGGDSSDDGSREPPTDTPGNPGPDPDTGDSDTPPSTSPDPITPDEDGEDSTPDIDTGDIVEAGQCTDTTYGPRQLKLLSRDEYQASIEDLIGIDFDVSASIPFDSLVEGYSNNAGTFVSESHADAYLAVAESVAAWSAERDFEGVVDCGSGADELSYEACKNRFLDEFAPRVFRRPLNAAERATYGALFDTSLTSGNIGEGLELGITALLTAPPFLYRSELGTPVQDLLDGGTGGGLESDGEAVTVYAVDFAVKTTGNPSGERGWNIYTAGHIQNSFDLPGDALIQIAMKGDFAGNEWPTMELAIDGQVVESRSVEVANFTDFQFRVAGFAGTHNVQIRFTNDFLQGAEDRNLHVESVTVSGVGEVSSVAEELDLENLDGDAYVLSDYEMASFLSYTYAGTTPDAELLRAAESGELTTRAQLLQQVGRLLSTDRAREHLGNFAAAWLGTDGVLTEQKNADLFPDFNDAIRAAMAAEVRAFFTHVFYDQTLGFPELFTADYTFANNALADFYGLGGVGSDSDLVQVATANRGGVLANGAFMTTYAGEEESSLIIRAVRVRQKFLCHDIPPPPNDIAEFRTEEEEKVKEELAGRLVSNREFVAAITASDLCSSCHEKWINPLGNGLEDFDAVGRPRTELVNGVEADASGSLRGVNLLSDNIEIPFNGARALSQALATEAVTQVCFAANVFRFAMDIGHDAIDANNTAAGNLVPEEREDYGCSVDTLAATMAENGQSMPALFSELGTLDLVRFRKQRDR